MVQEDWSLDASLSHGGVPSRQSRETEVLLSPPATWYKVGALMMEAEKLRQDAGFLSHPHDRVMGEAT